jgi:chitinase
MNEQDFAAQYWVQNGCPKEKLNIGLAPYGRCFTLTDANNNGLEAPSSGPCTAGKWTGDEGALSYYEASVDAVLHVVMVEKMQ